MSETAIEVDPQLIAFVLPSSPESVRIARFHIRAALGYHGLADYADDAEMITSELVTNAVQHVCSDGTETIGVTLARVLNPPSISIVVTDSSPQGPVKRDTVPDSGRGRGLQIVEALCVYWGWHYEDRGKSVLAILAQKT